ncbi:hypothetical protein NPIL_230551 [Nephila pilipes]|uniref:Uncharacterized protein n=1 Tax=Nephila pilipes TaxID=299642 RepID=A0A8X6U2V0_NEPPI|nr:hypothetical protein NPIL_230551 [Nephila pilipes]
MCTKARCCCVPEAYRGITLLTSQTPNIIISNELIVCLTYLNLFSNSHHVHCLTLRLSKSNVKTFTRGSYSYSGEKTASVNYPASFISRRSNDLTNSFPPRGKNNNFFTKMRDACTVFTHLWRVQDDCGTPYDPNVCSTLLVTGVGGYGNYEHDLLIDLLDLLIDLLDSVRWIRLQCSLLTVTYIAAKSKRSFGIELQSHLYGQQDSFSL